MRQRVSCKLESFKSRACLWLLPHTHTHHMCTHVSSHTCSIRHTYSHIHPRTHALTPTLTHGCQPWAQSVHRLASSQSRQHSCWSLPSVSFCSVSFSPPCLSFHGLSLCALDSVSLSCSSLPVPSSCYHSSSPAMPFSELSALWSHSLLSYLPASLSFFVCLSLSPVCAYILSPHIPQPGWTMKAGNGQLSSSSEPDNLDLSPLSQPSRPLCFLAGEELGGPARVVPSPHHPVGMGQTQPISDADG